MGEVGRGVAVLLALAALACAALAAAQGAPAASTTAEYAPGELIVRFKPGLRTTAQASIVASEGASLERRLAAPGSAVVRLPVGTSVSDAVRSFELRADVAGAQPNFVYRAQVIPNDLRFAELWGLVRIGAPQAWDAGTGSRSVTVAVADTGVEADHPDLAPNVVAGGHDFVGNDDDPRDEQGHGTHVAGIIGAVGNDGRGVTGVNWSVGLLPVRVLDASGRGTTATIADGFRYAASRARIVNASLGGGANDPALEAAIAAFPETLFVVAAGNSGTNNDALPTFPCAYPEPNVVCVAATDATDALAYFSNIGPTTVDLGAPGTSILSTWRDGDYFSASGTSMAAPHVAGAAALVWSRNPALTAAQVKATLLGSVDPLGLPVVSRGRLNVARATGAVVAFPPPPPPPAPPPPPPVAASPRPVKKTVKKLKKVTICHRGRTVKVRKSQLRKHRRHGDKLGACRRRARRR
ncbi:MAG TPA: S8 family serine peptidase [Gaiellaceae bacterium]|nr:S8 family serine peptidase [Gaiellaceae bacterium]